MTTDKQRMATSQRWSKSRRLRVLLAMPETTRMNISGIYIHDGRLLRVIEDAENARLTMECELPADEWSDELAPRILVFDDFCNYRICEGPIFGCPTLLDLQIIGEQDGRSRLRLDTTAGYRELDCRAIRVLAPEVPG